MDVEMESPPDPLDQPTSMVDHDMDLKIAQHLEQLQAGEWHANPRAAELAGVLSAIVECDSRLDQKYTKLPAVIKLFNKHPALKSKVEDAWRSNSYGDIRNIDFLQALVQMEHEHLSKSLLCLLKKGFSAAYKGPAVDAFYGYLKENECAFHGHGEDLYYGKFCSIVQSSGTGKTRLMLELGAKYVHVLYMNIRDKSDRDGYPPRDEIPADILRSYNSTEDDYYMQCCTFFSTIFKVFRLFLLKKVEKFRELSVIGSEFRSSFLRELKNEFDDVKKEITNKEAGRKVLKFYYDLMVKTDGFRRQKDGPNLVLALDEAHVLHPSNNDDFLPAAVLLRVIKEYSETDKHGVWVVFASTTSKVAHFAAPWPLFPSARVQRTVHLVFPPFTQLGWDQNSPGLNSVSPDAVANSDHIIRYGRPLWKSMKEGMTVEELLLLAQDKLCGGKGFCSDDNNQVLSVIAQRFCVDATVGHRNAVEYVAASVASHLRVCIKTTKDRTWSYTTYPSEPFLSCAAAEVLHTRSVNGTGSLQQSLQMLQKIINIGMIDIGQLGELVSRFVWLLAKDFFVRTKFGDHQVVGDTLLDCELIPVVDYLEFVFGPKVWEADASSRVVFQDAFINFSHWISMDKDIRQEGDHPDQMDIEQWMLCHWERTSAVQCCHNQPLIDKIIPVYYKERDKGNPTMSQILISDRARVRSQHSVLQKIRRNHDSICSPDYDGPPYIVILADFGLENQRRFEAKYSKDDKCLRIYASGLGATTYPFLEDRRELTEILKDLFKQQTPPRGRILLEALEDQVQFGRSSEPRSMDLKRWEDGKWVDK